ncbi:cold shock protein 2-like [Nasonia vitripennis]|uniref:Uncharacterized protein n=1 Tax=Nasonia vitripennis TaxID=7425 RepID=A0A7M7GAZ0_NASVI|nr:cold shock protein 2-like [Nasonia vitripennis]
MSRLSCLLLCAVLTLGASVLAKPAEIRIERATSAVSFPRETAARLEDEEPILSEAAVNDGLEREQRSPDGDDYEEVEEDGPEGRHLKKKLKRKFKPHKYGHGGGLLDGLLGGYGGYGGHGGHGHGGHGHGGHGHGGHGGYGCRKLHGCGGGYGGWQQPSYGGGPIAAAFAGPNPGYGGWNPGYGGGYGGRPQHAQSQVASWNFGPFQATFGLAQAQG